MANIKSAKKRILVTETRAARNKSIRSEVKTATRKLRLLLLLTIRKLLRLPLQ